LRYLSEQGIKYQVFISPSNEIQQVETYEEFLRHELEAQNDELIAKNETKQREKLGKGMA
jgi:hypothetical protein